MRVAHVGSNHGNVQALHPLLHVLLTLGLEHVRLVVGEDLKGSRNVADPFPHGFDTLDFADGKGFLALLRGKKSEYGDMPDYAKSNPSVNVLSYVC